MECEIKDIGVYYEAFGDGRPIVLLHGWSIDHHHILNALEPVFEHRQGWRRIYPDLPGHGRTPGREWIADQDQMLAVILEFIDKVVGKERFVVGGTSAGAYLARGVVHHRQSSLDGLLLVVPLIVAEDGERTVPPHVVLVEEQDVVAELKGEEAEVFGLAVVQSRRLLERIRSDAVMAVGDEGFQKGIREHPERYAFSFDVDDLSEPFEGPTLILAGRQDAVVGYRDAWEIVENYPRGTFAVMDRAGHLLEIEQESLLQVMVSEWLDRVEEYAEGR